MNWARLPRTLFVIAFIAIAVAMVMLVVRLTRVSRGRLPELSGLTRSGASPSQAATPQPPLQRVSSTGPIVATPSAATSSLTPAPNQNPAPTIPATATNLIVPVAGVRPDQLRDTFSEARSEGRTHDAIDILAPMGTAVLAAADGTIVKLFHSDRGGTTIYQLSADSKFFYYYAHLDRYAEGLAEGQVVMQGANIGYVGDTGNAGAGNYHLHFSISVASDPKRYWEGVNINPYPLLRR